MKSNIIRSNVFIIPNAIGAVYEATEDPDIFKVNLRQVNAWFENTKLKQDIREVSYKTEISLFQKGFVIPGNILEHIRQNQ